MGTANRVQLAMVRETTPGVTPGSPRMRTVRFTKEALNFTPQYIDSDELRADRNQADPSKVMQASDGSIDFEFSFPDDNSPMSEILRSAFYNPWVNTPVLLNDGVADSVITDAGTTANTYTVAAGGAAFKTGMLVRASGFTNAANNKNFVVSASTATTIAGTALALTAEAAPPGTAKLKVIGFAGAAADITAAAGGLASTTLDFTTLGLSPGQWLKIDSTTNGLGFATAANNDWVRISGPVTAHAIPLDNLPVGWSVDAGTGKTITVYMGDQIKNGVTQTSHTYEKGFLDQAAPTYIVNKGMSVDTLSLSFSSKQLITGTASFTGMAGGESQVSLDAVPDPATTGAVMAANANIGRIAEAGATLTSPNWAKELTVQISNNQRTLESIDQASPVGINPGDCNVTGRISTYFGSDTILQKIYNGNTSSINARVAKNGQAVILQIPRETLRGGNPAAQGKNTDIMLDSDFTASLDSVTGAQILMDRLEYFA